MASSKAACVLGGVRLISSARMVCENIGPSRNRRSRVPVARFSSMISVPVMSAGIRSGVNWMRLNVRFSVRDSVLIMSVLASPGTPSNRQCPRLNRQMSSSSIDLLLTDDDVGQLPQNFLPRLSQFADGCRIQMPSLRCMAGHVAFLVLMYHVYYRYSFFSAG